MYPPWYHLVRLSRRRSSAAEQGTHKPSVGGSNPPVVTQRLQSIQCLIQCPLNEPCEPCSNGCFARSGPISRLLPIDWLSDFLEGVTRWRFLSYSSELPARSRVPSSSCMSITISALIQSKTQSVQGHLPNLSSCHS